MAVLENDAKDVLDKVKDALGVTGDYQDSTLQAYIDEVTAFLEDAGVKNSYITSGVIARGVADLWNYGAGEGKLSSYFMQRATQLALKGRKTSTSNSTPTIVITSKLVSSDDGEGNVTIGME